MSYAPPSTDIPSLRQPSLGQANRTPNRIDYIAVAMGEAIDVWAKEMHVPHRKPGVAEDAVYKNDDYLYKTYVGFNLGELSDGEAKKIAADFKKFLQDNGHAGAVELDLLKEPLTQESRRDWDDTFLILNADYVEQHGAALIALFKDKRSDIDKIIPQYARDTHFTEEEHAFHDKITGGTGRPSILHHLEDLLDARMGYGWNSKQLHIAFPDQAAAEKFKAALENTAGDKRELLGITIVPGSNYFEKSGVGYALGIKRSDGQYVMGFNVEPLIPEKGGEKSALLTQFEKNAALLVTEIPQAVHDKHSGRVTPPAAPTPPEALLPQAAAPTKPKGVKSAASPDATPDPSTATAGKAGGEKADKKPASPAPIADAEKSKSADKPEKTAPASPVEPDKKGHATTPMDDPSTKETSALKEPSPSAPSEYAFERMARISREDTRTSLAVIDANIKDRESSQTSDHSEVNNNYKEAYSNWLKAQKESWGEAFDPEKAGSYAEKHIESYGSKNKTDLDKARDRLQRELQKDEAILRYADELRKSGLSPEEAERRFAEVYKESDIAVRGSKGGYAEVRAEYFNKMADEERAAREKVVEEKTRQLPPKASNEKAGKEPASPAPAADAEKNESGIDPAILKRLKDNDKTLTALDLSYKNLGDTDMKSLAEAMKGNTHLKKLAAAGNNIGDEGAIALAGTSIKDLDLSDNKIGKQGVAALAKMNLDRLSLDSNNIQNTEAAALAKANIRELSLMNNKIGDEGAKAFADAHNITVLNLACNAIGDNGVEGLAVMLENNSVITSLAIGFNSFTEAAQPSVARIETKLKKNLESAASRSAAHGAGGAEDTNAGDEKGGKRKPDGKDDEKISSELIVGALGLAALVAGLLSGMDFFMALIMAVVVAVVGMVGMDYLAKQDSSDTPAPQISAAPRRETSQQAAVRQPNLGDLVTPEASRFAVQDMPAGQRVYPGSLPAVSGGLHLKA